MEDAREKVGFKVFGSLPVALFVILLACELLPACELGSLRGLRLRACELARPCELAWLDAWLDDVCEDVCEVASFLLQTFGVFFR